MAPRIDIPVLAVMDEALRRNFATCFLIASTAVVSNLQPTALKHRRSGDPEILRRHRALGQMQNPNALVHFGTGMCAAPDRRLEPLEQRRDVRTEQTRLETLQQPLHGEQREDFSVAEPKAG